MDIPPNPTKPACSYPNQQYLDFCNALMGSIFLILGAISFSHQDWWEGMPWLCIAAGCAISIGMPCTTENWKQPRSLAVIFLLVLGAFLFFATPADQHHQHSFPKSGASVDEPTPPAK